jgi:hypothetical protein
MFKRPSVLSSICLLALVTSSITARADNLTTTSVQASGQNWTAAIWKTNSPGVATNTAASVAPVAGNTYEEVFNGVLIGNGAASTRVRNPATAGTQTFPGDSLTMYTNTELRAKQSGVILNFPGKGGNPGLVLNGGMLNGGDDATFPISGNIQIATQSYISHGAAGGAGGISQNRAFNFTGVLSGTGNMVILNAGTTVPQQVSGNANTFSGQWIIQCGWLQGNAANSLGTNSITADPLDTAAFLGDMPNAVSPSGPAWFEPNYDINSAGVLTLTNGGLIRLHQNCIFSSVVIEGNSLSAGTHPYSELISSYPTNLAAGGSGSITVRPYSQAPVVTSQPGSVFVYSGGSARFSVGAAGAPPFTYQWQKNGAPLTDGGNISGSTTPTLVINNVSAGDATTYNVVVSNAVSSATSDSGILTLITPSGSYETAVAAAHPFAFYQFNETGDPASYGLVALDNAGGYNGVYGNAVQNGNTNYNISGPRASDGFAGFGSDNLAASFTNGARGSLVSVTPWALNTNTVTIMAWVKPSGPQVGFEGIVFCRGVDTIAGLNYSGNTDGAGNFTLGYTWNNEPETYNWNSGLVAPLDQWSLVALVVTPANATIYLMNTNGLVSATHDYSHVVQSFNGTTLIGDDSNDGGNGARGFNGVLDDVAVFNSALSKSQLVSLLSPANGGVTNFGPVIAAQPASASLFAGQTAQFTVSAGGSDPLSYQWQVGATGSGIYSPLTDGGRIAGAATATLTVANIGAADAGDYIVVITNLSGSVTSSVATLTVQATGVAESITMTNLESVGADWDIGDVTPGSNTNWSDANPASYSAAAFPGSTYELLKGARLRTPATLVAATFPGNVLKVDGNGVWLNNPGAGSAMAEIRFKQPTLGVGNGVVNFKQLIMNGGQLDTGSPGTVALGGEIDIVTNTPFYNDGTLDQGYLVNAWLTGGSTSSIEYHAYNIGTFQTGYSNNLNIAGTSNTFSGKWNIVLGTLLGTGTNSLGTNDITIGSNGALETTYNITNPVGNLFLSGRMFLHQNDTFRTVFVNGAPLSPGTYTFAQLNTTYPTNFPSTWTPQNGAANFITGSGSITVLVQPAPVIVQQPQPLSLYPGQTASFLVQAQGNPPLTYQWRLSATNLSDNVNLVGSKSNNLIIPSPNLGDAGDYTVVVANSIGSITSIVATLTVLQTSPATNITLNFGGAPIVQPAGSDWNTVTNWSDGNPASLSVYSSPGSTYDVVVGSRLRPPAGTNYAAFPGNVLTVEGGGIYEDNTLAGVGEFRFKHSDPGTNYFPKLVLNGGQLDNGDNGLVVIQGQIDVATNSTIYVDVAAGVDRSYQIDAALTGSGELLWHQWGTGLGGPCLNIASAGNTFSGRWIVDQGTLLGSGLNSLGTNDIAVAATGALETLYDVNNASGSLSVDGQMFLHQNDTFNQVTIAGVPLAAGTYTFTNLNAAYPANFPATWTQQLGSTVSTGSGSITVVAGGVIPPPPTLGIGFSGGNLTITWSHGLLLEANDVTGPWTTNTTATSPFTIVPSGPRQFYRVLGQ